MTDRGRNHHKKTSRCGQGSRKTTCYHEADDPFRQLSNLRARQYGDIVIDRDFVRQTVRCVRTTDLHQAIAVLIFKADQTCTFPVLEPFRNRCTAIAGDAFGRCRVVIGFDVSRFVDCIDDVVASERANRRSDCVEQRNEDERPASRHTRRACTANREEADDNVRKTRCTEHKGASDRKHVDPRFVRARVLDEAEFRDDLVQVFQHGNIFTANVGDKAKLWNRIPGDHHGDEDCRYGVSENQNAVLSHLRVGDALHAAQNRVNEYDAHADQNTGVEVHAEEARERDTHAGHLTRDVCEGHEQSTDNRDDASRCRVITVAHKVRHGELAEFAKEWREE